MNKLKLTKIELETANGFQVSLTMEEARELHEQLDALFGQPKEVTKFVPTAPIYIERWPRWGDPYRTWPVWYGDTTVHQPADALRVEGNSGLKATYWADNTTETA